MQGGGTIEAEGTDRLSALGIADFREPALDDTAGFSIEDDLKIARLLAYAYDRSRTYNELVGIYEELRLRNIARKELGPVRWIACSEPSFPTVRISFIPSRLRSTVMLGRIRGAVVKALNSPLGNVADLLINRTLLGIMPYHAAVRFKKPLAKPRAGR
jgi:hypothetical protein